MTEQSPQFDDEQEKLIAYLDGELDESATKEVEQQLSESSEVRSRINSLARTWDMLDYLPCTKASDNFSEQTLSSIQVIATEEAVSTSSWLVGSRRGFILAGWAAGLAIAALIGFSITHSLVKNDSDELIGELPVIENLDIYTEIGNAEYLTLLKESHLFDEEQ